MKRKLAILIPAALCLLPVTANASNVVQVVRIIDTSGSPVSGVSFTAGGVALTAGVSATTVPGSNMDTGAAITNQTLKYFDMGDGTGEYVFVYDPVSIQAHFSLLATKSGVTISNPTVGLNFFTDPSSIAATKTLVTIALPAVTPGNNGGIPLANGSNQVAISNALPAVDGSNRVLLQPVQTGVVIPTVTTITNGVTVATNNDKTGYALTTGEHTAIQTDAATGILVAPSQKIATNASNQVVASSVQGNVTGSVASVTGNVGGNVTGDVQGKVIGGGSSSITGNGVNAANFPATVSLSSGDETHLANADTQSATTVSQTSSSVIGTDVWNPLTSTYVLTGSMGLAQGSTLTQATNAATSSASASTQSTNSNAAIANLSTKIGTPAGASVSADIAALPTAATMTNAVLAAGIDGSITFKQEQALQLAIMTGKYTTSTTNGITTTTYYKQDATTVLAVSTLTISNGTTTRTWTFSNLP